jgi:hypothetical protein
MRLVNSLLIFLFIVFFALFMFMRDNAFAFYFMLFMMLADAFTFGLVNGEHRTEQRLKKEGVEP